jgi:hypothetical protein
MKGGWKMRRRKLKPILRLSIQQTLIIVLLVIIVIIAFNNARSRKDLDSSVFALGSQDLPVIETPMIYHAPPEIKSASSTEKQADNTPKAIDPEAIADYMVFSVVDYEGSTHDTEDPGGVTKYGISSRSYPQIDIRSLTRAKAAEIIKKDFYYGLGINEFKSLRLQHALLHMAVLIGPKALDIANEVKNLEALKQISDSNPKLPKILNALKKKYADYLRSLNNPKFVKGWLRRVNYAFYSVD